MATVLVLFGSFKVFERVMACGIVIMFITVCLTALLLGPDWGAAITGLVPTHPGKGEPLDWTIALVGGVGGTVTVLCYGYWMRQAGRTDRRSLSTCRVDLLVAYAFTAVFGIAMLVIASGVEIEGKGTGLLIALSEQLGEALGPFGAMIFLIGAWAAIVSSLLGVWQSVPLLFADATRSLWGLPSMSADRLVTTKTYRVFLLLLATVPMGGKPDSVSHRCRRPTRWSAPSSSPCSPWCCWSSTDADNWSAQTTTVRGRLSPCLVCCASSPGWRWRRSG